MKTDIRSMNLNELTEFLSQLNQPKFRAAQIFKWLQSGVETFDQMTNIPKPLREVLAEKCYIANVEIVKRLESKIDGTVKYVYKLFDGEFIESVLMKYEHGYTVCISTQVGCRMGCSFCASGLCGLKRNLTASEMLSQIMMAAKDNNIRVSNVVMMGMGEPLDNFHNSVRFLELVSSEEGLGIGMRHISLSTSGVVSGIEKLKEYNLKQQLNKIAANRLFGNRVKLYSRAVLILCVLMLAALVLDKLLLSVALLAVLVVYAMWYSAVIEKEANKIRAEMELTEE